MGCSLKFLAKVMMLLEMVFQVTYWSQLKTQFTLCCKEKEIIYITIFI